MGLIVTLLAPLARLCMVSVSACRCSSTSGSRCAVTTCGFAAVHGAQPREPRTDVQRGQRLQHSVNVTLGRLQLIGCCSPGRVAAGGRKIPQVPELHAAIGRRGRRGVPAALAARWIAACALLVLRCLNNLLHI